MEAENLSQEQILDMLSDKATPEEPKEKVDEAVEKAEETPDTEALGKVADAFSEKKPDETAAELEVLRARVKELESNPPLEFANDTIKRLNQIVKEGKLQDLTLAASLVSSKMEDMDDLDVMVLQKVLESPNFKGSETLLKKNMGKGYTLNRPSDYDDLSDEEQQEIDDQIKYDSLRLKEDADRSRKHINELLDVKMPETKTVDPKELEAQKEKLKSDWAEVSPKIMEQVTKIPVPVKMGDKDEMFLEFDVTDSIKKDFEKRIVDYATQSGMPLTEESIRGLFGMVADAIRRENESLINAAIAEKARTQAIEDYKKEIHNPSALSSERKAAEKKVDGQQELLNALAPK